MFESNLEQPINIETDKLHIRLAANEEEIRAAQTLRYDVFYNEMNGKPTEEQKKLGYEFDQYDPYCDHLIAIDKSSNEVIGTYRFLRGSVVKKTGCGFIAENEFDISKLVNYDGEIVELGRSCVHPDYRTKAVIQNLWQGIGAFICFYDIDILMGCASFSGTNTEEVSNCLAYLYHYHLAPPSLRAKALEERYIDMRCMDENQIDRRLALYSLPPLIKGYLRVGAFVGDGAVIDKEFNTIDVCVILKAELISERYRSQFVDTKESEL